MVGGPDAISATEEYKEFTPDPATTSKLSVHEKQIYSSGATRPSAISSSFNILADGSAVEEKESIVGNLLEKAIDDIDQQMEEDAKLKAQKQQALEEEAKVKEAQVRAETEAKANAETEAQQKLKEQQEKAQAEAKVSLVSMCPFV